MIFRNRSYPKACTPDMVFEELEARIVLDASVDHVIGHDSSDLAQSHHDFQQVGLPAASAHADIQSDPGHAPGLDLVLISDSVKNADSIAQAAADDATVIVYDANQEDLHSIVDSLVVMVDESGDNISTLAILDHAQKGRLQVGTDRIDASNVAEHSADLDALRARLTEDGQIQLYGCSLAADDAGKALVGSLAARTGADVFASDDDSGGPTLDWDLEHTSSPSSEQAVLLDYHTLAAIDTRLALSPLTCSTSDPAVQAVGVVDVDCGSAVTINDDDPFILVSLDASASGLEYVEADPINLVTPTHPGGVQNMLTIQGVYADVVSSLATLHAGVSGGMAVGTYTVVVNVIDIVGPFAPTCGDSFTITVEGPNTAPTIISAYADYDPNNPNDPTGGAPYTETTYSTAPDSEDCSVTGSNAIFPNVGDLLVDDAEVAANPPAAYYIELETQYGILNVPDALVVAGTLVGDESASVSFEVTDANVDALFQQLEYCNTVGLHPVDYVDILVSDQGVEGTGGELSANRTVKIAITAANDPPLIDGPDPVVAIANRRLTFTGDERISVSDKDAGTNPIQVTVTASTGVMSVADPNAVTMTVGDGYQDTTITFLDTVTNINRALSGLTYQTFPGTAPFWFGAATITIDSDDLGWSEGGVNNGNNQTDQHIINIDVQEPVLWGRWPRGVC